MLFWLLLHWKIVVIIGGIGLVAFAAFTPIVLRFLIKHRIALAVILALFISHGAVAVGVQRWYDATERLAEIERQRDEAQRRAVVAEADAQAAEIMRVELEEYQQTVEELRNALENADGICFGESDADRLRSLF